MPLTPSGGAWRCTVTAPEEPDLLWYDFTLTRGSGETVSLTRSGGPWQLTVYEDTGTPEWFGQGVSYQIFPDRFCRSRLPQPEGLVGERTVHENWEDTPDYLPDEKGEIRNCDFFGGDFRGITEKLDYLQSLSVTTLYLNPIFEAASNHRYNTADYRAVDPMLGTEEDFRELCRQAHKRGMRLLLDGVFNHTGSVSRYFNRDGFYPELGRPNPRPLLIIIGIISPAGRRYDACGAQDPARGGRGAGLVPGVYHPGPGLRGPRWLRPGPTVGGWRWPTSWR